MKGGVDDERPPSNGDESQLDDLFDGREWRTGTSLDHYTPIYRMLRLRGIGQHDADRMDITNVALELGVAARGVDGDRTDDDGPIIGADGLPVAGTAPAGIKPPAWWRGNRSAYRTSTRAARQLSGHQGGME